jgi:uncharacterized protein
MDDGVEHEEQGNRGSFFIDRDGVRVARMTYRRTGPSTILIDHTLVDPALRGGGMARRLLDAAVAWARGTHTKITPHCSYVVAQFDRDQSIGDVLAGPPA